LDFFIQNGNGKKMYFDEVKHLSTSVPLFPLKLTLYLFRTHRMAGRPSRLLAWSPKVIPPSLVSAASNNILTLLDDHCTDLKSVVSGGIGWFAHIYSDTMEPGYGIYTASGKLKFPFAPRTSC
jgi:hypothetical protein